VKDDRDEVYRPSKPWTGFYVGAHSGYGWGEASGTLEFDAGLGPVPGVFAPGSTIEGDGFLGGFTLGANKQVGGAVWGIEIDGSWGDINGRGSFDTLVGPPPVGVNWQIDASLNALATVRGRLGFLAGPALLVYGTGGLAIGWTSADLVVRQCCGFVDDVTARGSADQVHVGWTAGGGLEWAMGGGWSLKTEYLYVDLGSADYRLRGDNLISGIPHTTDSLVDTDITLHVVRAGLNYKF
jgi:outer membrane immunogenic protein